jgi:hypothetical protein
MQAVERWSPVSPPCFADSTPSGRPSCHQKPSSARVRRPAIPPGATACSRPSPPSSSCCDSFCMATPRAPSCPTSQAYASVHRLTVKRARNSPSTSLASCEHASALPCSPTCQMQGGGTGITPLWSMARAAPCPIPWKRAPDREHGAEPCPRPPARLAYRQSPKAILMAKSETRTIQGAAYACILSLSAGWFLGN